MNDLLEETKVFGLIDKNTVRLDLLDDSNKNGVKYGLNWAFDPITGDLRIEKGKSESSRSGNESYLQLPKDVYMSDFFPESEDFHVTDDLGNDFIFNRSQPKVKDGKPQALSTPESNKILGLYIRHRLGLRSGALITKEDLLNYGRTDIIFKKDDNNLYMDFSSYKGKNGIKKITNNPLQQIFYGAPGTGKSHRIKNNDNVKKADEKNLVFRTTFHPDSDYSTFVGAYKPTTTKRAVRNVAGDIVRDTNKEEVYEDCITYSFIPQAFLQAYVAAWNNPDDKVFLVIEEINRGNCAQIFGDLFQLLDRDDDGASEYPIMADKDIAKYLNGNDEEGRPVLTNKDGIKDGKLRLPKNLHIWATMNTSDQSLFPIDSAFKRRWDWVYIPIADAKKNYVIEIDNDQYDWWSFLEAINAIIESTTHSEDKKLGYFFAKAKDGRITADTFVGKVIFYLWNDVFKDNETNHKAFKDSDGELLAFRKFFHNDGTVDTNMVIKFLQDLEVYPFETSDDGTAMVSDTTLNAKRQRDKSRYRVNGTDNLNKAQMTREAFRLYIEAHPDADAQTIAQAWNGLGLRGYVQHLVETEDEYIARTKNSTDTNKRATKFELSNGEMIFLSTEFGIENIGKFIAAVNNAGWNIRIENQD